ncbi:kinase binding protein CGI-121-domain-containing protein [Scheffersomyces coipomensis]|uniref:kinase binding protein CGI-121-domain-containing protein n=1 Tax=Scheffersomyces coipomensis TaxID=1788519 RepID=UPI00315CD731
MGFITTSFPQFPQFTVFISLFTNIKTETSATIKSELIGANKDYDFCFLNTNHIISLEQLYASIHRSILNQSNELMKAKTLNTEIIFNLSSVNNIMDALKRFGVDESCPNLIVIKVLKTDEIESDTLKELNQHLLKLLDVDESHNIELNDEILFSKLASVQKTKKLYKLNDATYSGNESELQAELTRLIIGATLLRGF